MTKKDYIKAAQLVSDSGNDMSPNEQKRLANVFVRFFQNDNPRFDRGRFLAACNLFNSQEDK